MNDYELATLVISGLALLVSAGTAGWVIFGALRVAKRADMTVYLHWLSATARVVLPGGKETQTGYHLVLRNRGPADAREVTVAVAHPGGRELALVAIERDEFPLSTLDGGSRYPIPFALAGDVHEGPSGYRRFVVTLTWRDGRRDVQSRRIPIRRGQTGGAGD